MIALFQPLSLKYFISSYGKTTREEQEDLSSDLGDTHEFLEDLTK